MNLTNARATFGLQAKATPVKSGSTGTTQIGANNATLSLTATKLVAFDALIVGTASDLVIDISDLDNTGSTAWTAGAAQVETATAAGTITLVGNATITVTSAGMTGSPKAISVPVELSDTATLWAAKVRTALAADAAVAARFSVSGGTTAIILTRKPTSTYTINGTSIPVYPANDGTLNVASTNGTCTGITPAASSVNTTAGVLTAGTYAPDLDGTDFEGEATGGMSNVSGLNISCFGGITAQAGALVTQSTVLTDYPVNPSSHIQIATTDSLLPSDDITISPAVGGDNSCFVTVTIAGE